MPSESTPTSRGGQGGVPPFHFYRFRFGNADFNQQSYELWVAGVPVEIQRRPLELLSCLLAHPGEVVTKEELLERVWEGRPTVENVIANAVTKLRNALGETNAARIVTLPRIGYRFDGPLERIAVGRAHTSALELTVGATVPSRPNFQLESLLSQAPGNNEVWLARHTKTGEPRVYKFSADGTRLAMLKREATISRLLRVNLGERPDFAWIRDWNFETPPFFLECEFGGENLQQWHSLAALSVPQRVELLLRIADALGAAHSVGVLHKDLKPANVLVAAKPDGDWQIRLTDFGSSRLLEPERLAELGISRLGLALTTNLAADSSGTPLYLAPELIGGAPPTIGSDVYALGIILYQLVVGDLRRPLASGWERNIENPLLCEDIAAAIDGDPSRRLASVAELARRLRNLDARQAERTREHAIQHAARINAEALQRSRARRPWMIAAILVLAAGLGTSLWLYQGARRANARSNAINDFLYRDVLSNTGALKTDNDADPTMRRVLREAAAKVGTRFAGDPASEGWIRMSIGEGLAGLGDYAAGEAQQRQAVQLLDQAPDARPDRVLIASYTLAMTLLEQSKFAAAEAALSNIDKLTDTSLRDSETFLKSAGLRGMLRATRKECAAALQDLSAAVAVKLPASSEYLYNQFNLRSWIGETLNCLNRPAEAAAIYRDLLQDQQGQQAAGPALVGYAHLGQAKALQRLGQIQPAKLELTESLRILQQGVGDSDSFTMGQAWVEAGGFHAELREFDVASDYLQRGRKLLLQVGEDQEKALNALRMMGVIDYARGNIQQAIDELSAARAGLTRVFGESSPDVQGTNYWLAVIFSGLGRFDEAAQLVAALRPQSLQASLGGEDWNARLEALRKTIRLPK